MWFTTSSCIQTASSCLLQEAGNPDRAQRILAELVLRNKSNARAWHSLADLCVRKGPPKWDRARECYRNAVELGPSQVDSLSDSTVCNGFASAEHHSVWKIVCKGFASGAQHLVWKIPRGLHVNCNR
jgi:tetratricopeptide (TPR) repeat protein